MVLGITLILVAAVLASYLPTRVEESMEYHVFQVGKQTYVTLNGDFGRNDGNLTASVDSDGVLSISISGQTAESGRLFQWTVFDDDHPFMTGDWLGTVYAGVVTEGNQPSLSLGSQYGSYSLSVRCFDNSSKQSQRAEYKGEVIYSKPVEILYEWEYEGIRYKLDTSFNYSEYVHYKKIDVAGRGVMPFGQYGKFITPSDLVIVDIASKLRNAYGYPDEHNRFAGFVLSFVQMCFEYPLHTDLISADEYKHGVKEYFAFPLETLFNGGGDCEDTSILLTSIYIALGMDSALVFLPNHVMSGVRVDGYVSVNRDPLRYEALIDADGGFLACETTVDELIDVGIVPFVDVGGHPYSYYLGKESPLGDTYGFYPMGP
ncbi:MAG: hypothetical protein LBS92_06940 [Candidatus Methanoplasma sp.]|nr:hypothetical protein [Candidatus Methanoplasma sp.]